ncbi:Small heat shock protein HSP [Parasponia andersonii]|uniref:Small heat shock protein HSP n=1 Tax=Parasponia andersonii TaxID=3476 RepID=A0A2P5DSD8_PARAD|nr:Small heat shock protein HSP [Parasponia andersonii]
MELELGLKITQSKDDVTSTTDLRIAKDPSGPVFMSRETDSKFILTAHLKGFARERIEVNISEDGREIDISGERPVQEMVMSGWMVHKKEVELKGFIKVFRIPDGVILDRIKAKFNEQESVLTILMPKSAKGIRGVRIEELKEEELVDRGRPKIIASGTTEVKTQSVGEVEETDHIMPKKADKAPKKDDHMVGESSRILREEKKRGKRTTKKKVDELKKEESDGVDREKEDSTKDIIKEPTIKIRKETRQILRDEEKHGKRTTKEKVDEPKKEESDGVDREKEDRIVKDSTRDKIKEPKLETKKKTLGVLGEEAEKHGIRATKKRVEEPKEEFDGVDEEKVEEAIEITQVVPDHEISKREEIEQKERLQEPDVERSEETEQQKEKNTTHKKETPAKKKTSKEANEVKPKRELVKPHMTKQAPNEEAERKGLPEMKEQIQEERIPEENNVFESKSSEVSPLEPVQSQESKQENKGEERQAVDGILKVEAITGSSKEVVFDQEDKHNETEIEDLGGETKGGEKQTEEKEGSCVDGSLKVEEKKESIGEGKEETTKPASSLGANLCVPGVIAGSSIIVSLLVFAVQWIRSKKREVH